jgi:cell wall-associated NlpC family hydrolase
MRALRPSSLVAENLSSVVAARVAALDDPYLANYGSPDDEFDADSVSDGPEQLIDPAIAAKGLEGRLSTWRTGETLTVANLRNSSSGQNANFSPAVYRDDAPSSAKSLRTNKGLTASVLTNAYAETGKPYLATAGSPDKGFDNVGFVVHVYAKSGVRVPAKGAKEIMANGKAVTKDELRPGDMLVYRDPKDRARHVLGIYSGNGNFLLASNRLNIVTETAAFGTDYGPYFVGGRRFYDDPESQPLPETMKMAVTNGAVIAALKELGDRKPSYAPTKVTKKTKKKTVSKKKVTKKSTARKK